MKLERWAVIQGEVDPYQPPELAKRYISGMVYGNIEFPEGYFVRTSELLFVEDGHAFTKSGSIYKLGDVHPDYEKRYPNALERLNKAGIVT